MSRQYTFEYTSADSLGDFQPDDLELVVRAKEAVNTAYAPLSGFRVGAAARLKSGKIFSASNQENSVAPAGVCAERNLCYFLQANHFDDPVTALAIASAPDTKECYPCGICRQVMVDIEKRQGSAIRVIMTGRESATIVETAADLLPFAFEM